jgi:hypothetical protein
MVNKNKKDDFHIDMSGRIYEKKTFGIAIVGTNTKYHRGCAISAQMLKKIKKELFKKNVYYDSAKLYSICIFVLIKDMKDLINELIICNDEDFELVKRVLDYLLKEYSFKIINITEFRKRLGRKISSPADNYARIYRKRALKPTRHHRGKKMKVIRIPFKKIKQYWRNLNKNEM